MRAGRPTGGGIRLRVYGVRLVADEEGRLVPTGERYRIPRAPAAQAAEPHPGQAPWSGCTDPAHEGPAEPSS